MIKREACVSIGLLNISFKQKLTPNKSNNKKKKDTSVKLSEFYKYRRNEVVSEPIDKRFAGRRTIHGTVSPTSYDDCYEKMSFENDNDADIWRDLYYEEDNNCAPYVDYRDELFGLPALQKSYFYQNYSYDDIPLSDSIVRKELCLFDAPQFEIDTDLTEDGARNLQFINFLENIVPTSLHCKPEVDYETISELANSATMLRECGYSTNAIIRGLERCVVKHDFSGESYAEPKLFEFLVKHPNLRSAVVVKNNMNEEHFDKTFVNYFDILKDHYFDNEKDVRSALNYCRVKNNGFYLVDRNLCEIVGLMRHKSAQGIPFVEKKEADATDSESKKNSKYCERNLPLTQNDIALLDNIKKDKRTFQIKLHLAKSMLKTEEKTVKYVLSNIDKMTQEILEQKKLENIENDITEETLTQNDNAIQESQGIKSEALEKRLQDIRALKYELLRNCDENGVRYVDDIESVLVDEVNYLNKQSIPSLDKSVLFESIQVMKDKNINLFGISSVLNKLSNIAGYNDEKAAIMKQSGINPVSLDFSSVCKFIDAVYYLGRVDKTLNSLLGKLCLSSGVISDVECSIIKKIKSSTKDDVHKLKSLIELMLELKVPNNILLENLDEGLKYYEKVYQSSRIGGLTLITTMQAELKQLIQLKNFSCEKAPILQVAEKLLKNKITMTQAYSEINNLKMLSKLRADVNASESVSFEIEPQEKDVVAHHKDGKVSEVLIPQNQYIEKRLQDIEVLKSNLLEKYGENGTTGANNIATILLKEAQLLKEQSDDSLDKSILFEVVNILKDRNMALFSIYSLLNKFADLGGYDKEKQNQRLLLGLDPVAIKLDLESVNKYIDAVSYTSEKGALMVDKTLNSILGKLCSSSGKISDTELARLNEISPYLCSKTIAKKGIFKDIQDKKEIIATDVVILDDNQLSPKDNGLKAENIKKRLDDIQKLKRKLIDKYGGTRMNHIYNIENILLNEVEYLKKQQNESLDKSLLFEVAEMLIDKNMALHSVRSILNKFVDLGGYDLEKQKQKMVLGLKPVVVKLDLESVSKYVDAVSYKSEQGSLLVDKTLNSILGKLCRTSGKISDAEIAILNKIKCNPDRKDCNSTKKYIVEHMLDAGASTDLIAANFDEAVKYDTFIGRARYLVPDYRIIDALKDEFRHFSVNPDFSCEKAPVLNIVKMVLSKKIGIDSAIERINVILNTK